MALPQVGKLTALLWSGGDGGSVGMGPSGGDCRPIVAGVRLFVADFTEISAMILSGAVGCVSLVWGCNGLPLRNDRFLKKNSFGKEKAGATCRGPRIAGSVPTCELVLEHMYVIVNRAPLQVLFAFEKPDFRGAQMNNGFGATPRTIKRGTSTFDTEDDGEISIQREARGFESSLVESSVTALHTVSRVSSLRQNGRFRGLN